MGKCGLLLYPVQTRVREIEGLREASMKLIRKPKRPKLRTFLNVQISRNGPETWRHFLDLAYWNVELSD